MDKSNFKNIKTIGLDADDTLWVNETYFRETERNFTQLLSQYETKNKIEHALYNMHIKNLDIYGYGVKSFMLSMVECALDISQGNVDLSILNKVLDMGKDMLNQRVEVLDGVKSVLEKLNPEYRLLLITKGDLLDQERKLERSGLSEHFHHVEVLSHKRETNYRELLIHLGIPPEEFLMVGNSLVSDVIPVLNIGAKAIHIPFHTTWAHEMTDPPDQGDFMALKNIYDLLGLLLD